MAVATFERTADERIDWIMSVPFFAMHAVPFLAIFTGVNPIDVVLCVVLYYARIFCITAGFHRYFAHRTYKLNRFMQFLLAFGGTTSVQKGVLWWAALHRDHHRYSDTPLDIHSPKRGFYWSHMGWILCKKFEETPFENIRDFAKFPELRWINRHYFVPPVILGTVVFLIGGWSALLIGFVLSTVLLWHGTFTINSLAHIFGRRRYATTDTSRNSMLLSLITAGEGWHNNHHHYQSSVRLGFYWWELDFGYYVLKMMSWLGLARDLRKPPEAALTRNRVKDGCWDVGMLGEQPATATIAAMAATAAEIVAPPPEPSPS